MTTKSTPLTMEVFEEKIMPQFERIMEGYRSELLEFKTGMESTLKEMKRNELEVLTELQKLREEVTVAVHQYQRTNRRVDLIDRHLGISTSDLD